MRILVSLSIVLAACGASAEDTPSCATVSEHLAALEVADVGAGLPPRDRQAMAEALAAHRRGGMPIACAHSTPAQLACLHRASSMAEASACGGGLVAVSPAPTSYRQPPLPVPVPQEMKP